MSFQQNNNAHICTQKHNYEHENDLTFDSTTHVPIRFDMESIRDDQSTKKGYTVVTTRRLTSVSRRRPAERFSFHRLRPSSQRRSSTAGKQAAPRGAQQEAVDELLDFVDLDWYGPWVASHRARLPITVNALLDHGRTRDANDGFYAAWQAVHKYIQANRDTSIEEIIDHLEAKGVFNAPLSGNGVGEHEDEDDKVISAKRLLIFAILGWQSMVYLPELNNHPPDTLAIQHEVEGPDSGLVYDRYMIAAPSVADMCDRPLWVLLKCFGNLLPAHPSDLAVAGAADVAAIESSKMAASWTALYPDQLNAYLLHTLLRVRFRWVDSLALHLDYDKSTRTLSLFAFPSMCVAHLRGRQRQVPAGSGPPPRLDNNEKLHNANGSLQSGGTIFAFSSLEVQAADPRADEDDIAHFLQEVLVSYRLLFGQSAKARRLFRDVYSPVEAPFHQPDTLLPRLCDRAEGQQSVCPGLAELPPDRAIYYAARDFPVLYRRVELLADELKGAKPTSIRDLLNDRRDTLQFWTFWLVSVFGGASIFLALVGTVLQAIQIAQAAGKL